MIKVKMNSFLALGILVLLAGLSACSMPAVSKDSGLKSSALPVLAIIPNTAEVAGKVICYGANFTPGAKLRIVMMTFPDVETVLGEMAAGLALKTDAMGSFSLATEVPEAEGIYPIRVYGEDDSLIASTLVVVAKKKTKGK